MPSVVLVLSKSGYQNDDFLAAARKLKLDVITASDACHKLWEEWETEGVVWRAHDAAEAAAEVADAVRERAPAAIVGVDDRTALIASLAARLLGLPHNPPEAVAAARSKEQSRTRLRNAGLPVPRFQVLRLSDGEGALEAVVDCAPFPCVAKPVSLSASRGVIRADTKDELRAAIRRIAALLRSPEVAQRREADLDRVIVEEFLPGQEVAVEGLLQNGALRVLALFDKPDPLDGPYFEETLYVTPSRHPRELQFAVASAVSEG